MIPHGYFLHADLCLGPGCLSSEGHEHRGGADRGVEHLGESLLVAYIEVAETSREQRVALFAVERIDTGGRFCGGDSSGGEVGAPAESMNSRLRVGHESLPSRNMRMRPGVGYVRHVAHLDVFLMAIVHEFLHVLGLHYHRHALLALGNGEFGCVESLVFGCDAVQIYVKAVGELAYGHAHSSGSEIVRFLL